jgi:coenzyme Q-binding protein COQ10
MTMYDKRQHVRYTPEQMFDLVADVERYSDYLPWLQEAHISRRDGDRLWVEMSIGAGPVSRSFTTVARLDRPRRIEIVSDDSLFERFEQVWTFEPAEEGGSIVGYHLDFAFRSSLLHALMAERFADMAGTLMTAFRHRARAVYGAA